jgi:hypothetical protein
MVWCKVPRDLVALRAAAATIAVVSLVIGLFRLWAGVYSAPTASVGLSNAFTTFGVGELLAAVLLVTSVWVSFLANISGSRADLRFLNVLGGVLLVITSAISIALFSGLILLAHAKLPVVAAFSLVQICTGGFYLHKAQSFTATIYGLGRSDSLDDEISRRIRRLIRTVRIVGALIVCNLGVTIFMGLDLIFKYPAAWAFGFLWTIAARWALAAATLSLITPSTSRLKTGQPRVSTCSLPVIEPVRDPARTLKRGDTQ